LPPDTTGWRACYRHPKKPAIKDCAACGRPICRQCEAESSDPLLCPPCKEKQSTAAEPDTPETGEPGISPGTVAREDERLLATEVSVLDDGQVIIPGIATPEETTVPAEGLSDPHRETVAGAGSGGGEEPPFEPRRVPGAPAATDSTPRGPSGEEAHALLPRSEPASAAGWLTEGATGQLLAGLPYAIAAALAVIAAWLFLAFVGGGWTQLSVLTIGTVVPWAYYKATTLRKRNGRRVWNKPPRAIWISISSTVLVLLVIPATELIAYKIIYRVNPGLPFSDFMGKYLKSFDWLLVSGGVALAFLVPLLLERGENLRQISLFSGKGKNK
jgi:hypothetical protein